MIDLSENFWNHKYKTHKTGWDLGEISTPLKEYFNQLTNKEAHILIPGGGNSYEAEYLFNLGFKNVFVVDLAEEPLKNIQRRLSDFPSANLIHQNFFELEGKFDLIIEQTFFCAIHPNLRAKYAKKTHDLLMKDGKLVGLLFNVALNKDHPPFGGTQEEYLNYFTPYFDVQIIEPCFNSHVKRQGMELFVKLQKL